MEGLSSDIEMSADSEMDLENEEPPSTEAVLDMIDAFLETPSNQVAPHHLQSSSELNLRKREYLLKTDEDCYNSASSDSGSEKCEEYYGAQSLSMQDINLIIMGGPNKMEKQSNVVVVNKIESCVEGLSKCTNKEKNEKEDSNIELISKIADDVVIIPSSSNSSSVIETLSENIRSEPVNITDNNITSDCDVQIESTSKGSDKVINVSDMFSNEHDIKNLAPEVSKINLSINETGSEVAGNLLPSISVDNLPSCSDFNTKSEHLLPGILDIQPFKTIITEDAINKNLLDVELDNKSKTQEVQNDEQTMSVIQSSLHSHTLEAEHIEMSNVNLENIEIQTVLVDNSSESSDTVESDSQGATFHIFPGDNVSAEISKDEVTTSIDYTSITSDLSLHEDDVPPATEEIVHFDSELNTIEEEVSAVAISDTQILINDTVDSEQQASCPKTEDNQLIVTENLNVNIDTNKVETSIDNETVENIQTLSTPIITLKEIKEDINIDTQHISNFDIMEHLKAKPICIENISIEPNEISNIENCNVEILIEQKNEPSIKEFFAQDECVSNDVQIFKIGAETKDDTIECNKKDSLNELDVEVSNETDVSKDCEEENKITKIEECSVEKECNINIVMEESNILAEIQLGTSDHCPATDDNEVAVEMEVADCNEFVETETDINIVMEEPNIIDEVQVETSDHCSATDNNVVTDEMEVADCNEFVETETDINIVMEEPNIIDEVQVETSDHCSATDNNVVTDEMEVADCNEFVETETNINIVMEEPNIIDEVQVETSDHCPATDNNVGTDKMEVADCNEFVEEESDIIIEMEEPNIVAEILVETSDHCPAKENIQDTTNRMEVVNSDDFVVDDVVKSNESSFNRVANDIFTVAEGEEEIKEVEIEIQSHSVNSSPVVVTKFEIEDPKELLIRKSDDELKDELIVATKHLESVMDVQIQNKTDNEVDNELSKCGSTAENVHSYGKSTEKMELELIQIVEQSKTEIKKSSEESTSVIVEHSDLIDKEKNTAVEIKAVDKFKSAASTSQTIPENVEPKEEHRKVSPLKISLANLDTSPKTPKITIKPIIKPETDHISKLSEEVKSVPKLTIKVTESQTTCSHVVSMSTLNSIEDQVVPKLTIKTISKSDSEKSQPVVPKLTIKTRKEFDIECSVPENITTQTVPKLTIKTIVKPIEDQVERIKSRQVLCSDSEEVLTVPKLTIKNAVSAGEGTCHSPTSKVMKPLVIDTNESSTISKLKIKGPGSYSPKLTIKPIPEPEIPKLTIKLAKYESDNSDDSESMITSTSIPKVTIKPIVKPDELVPKLTIKLPNDTISETVHESIPKFTIKQIIKPENENLVIPKLTIKPIVNPNSLNEVSVQEHHTPKLIIKPIIKPSNKQDQNEVVYTKANSETHPKITIKPIVKPAEIVNESHPKITIKPVLKPAQSEVTDEHSKVTIKPIVKPNELDINEKLEGHSKTTTKPLIKSIQCEKIDVHPKVTIKPVVKHSELELNETLRNDFKISTYPIIKSIQSGEMEVHPKVTFKPIVKPAEMSEIVSSESHHKITIKPIIKPIDIETTPKIINKLNQYDTVVGEAKASNKTAKPIDIKTHEGHPKITIKPIVKSGEQESVETSTKFTIKTLVKNAEEQTSISKLIIKPASNPNAEPTDHHSKYDVAAASKSGVGNLELPLEGIPKSQIKAASKQDINELDRSNDFRRLENSSPKATMKRLIKTAEMEPLEINTNEKSTESGQESPRIILKINKTNQGSTSEIISDIKIDKNVQNECIVEKIKLKMNKQGSRAEIIQHEKLLEEPSTSKGVKRHLENSDVLEVKRIKTDEKTSVVQSNKEPEVLVVPKSLEKLRSEARLKEILSRIQQKIEDPLKHERVMPSILQQASTSSEIEDMNSSDATEVLMVLDSDSDTKQKSSSIPACDDQESSSGDCIIIEESSQSNDPSDGDICDTSSQLIDFNRECKIELINVPMPFQNFNQSPAAPKRRGRPRKNPLSHPESPLLHPLSTSTNSDDVVITTPAEERPKRRNRGRGTPKVPRGPRGRPRGSKRKRDTTPIIIETEASPMEIDELLSEGSFNQNMSESSMNISPTKEVEDPISPLMITPRPPRGRGSRGGRGRRGRGRGMRGRGAANKALSKKSPTIWQTPEGNKEESTLQVFEEDTRMSADLNSRGTTPAKQIVSGEVGNEESQSSVLSSATTESTRAKRIRTEVGDGEAKDFSVDLIAEYTWPPVTDSSARYLSDTYMIQEQIALFLGLRSFKRKYPDLKRRALDMQERDYVRENGLVTETLCDLGLTAVNSAEVLDIMCADFPQKYEEYRKYQRDKQAREFTTKQKALSIANNLDKNKKQSVKEQAIKSASSWNASFNKSRNESRRYCMDLQTFILNKPKRPVPPTPKVGNYPVALVPGQFCDYYKGYTPDELKYFPLDTVLYGPLKPNERFMGNNDEYSDSDSDSSTSDSDSDTSSSDDTQDTEDSVSATTLHSICKVCHSSETDETQLLRCSKCFEKTHTKCIDATDVMVNYIRAYPWQCSDCKSCCQCNLPSDDDKMLFCDQCDRGYHIYCVGLKKVPVGRWHCNNCSICNSCKTKNPDGNNSQNSVLNPPVNQWQHESTRNGHATLCMPCATLWRKNRYCTLCYRCHGDTDLLTACKVCNHQLHSDCVRRQYPGIDLAGVTCIDCAQKLVPITSSTIISQIQQNQPFCTDSNTIASSHTQKFSTTINTLNLQNTISTKSTSTNMPISNSVGSSSIQILSNKM